MPPYITLRVQISCVNQSAGDLTAGSPDNVTEIDRPDAGPGPNIQTRLRIFERREVEVAFETEIEDVMLKVFQSLGNQVTQKRWQEVPSRSFSRCTRVSKTHLRDL